MLLMRRWSPAHGSGAAVLRALPIVMVAVFQAQVVLSFEGSLTVLPSSPTSTLDARVSTHDLELQDSLLDFVESGLLTGRKPPVFRAPPSQLAEPKQLDVPDAKPLNSAGSQSQASPKLSPFRKWVKPETPGDATTETPNAAPKVARRLTKVPRPDVAKPLSSAPKKQDTAVASDKKAPVEPETTPPPKATKPEPKPSDYPSPQAITPTPKNAPQQLPPLTNSQKNLRKKIRSVLTHYYNRPLNTRDRSPWELMHAMLAFEAHSQVLQGGPKGEPITAVGWLCYNQACKRRTLMYVNDDGELRVRVGPALQGHRGQLLAMLAQSRINKNYPMLVEGHEMKIANLIEMEKRTCYPRTELTFKLIGLMHYLDSDATWLNDQGMEWDIPRMIAEEIRQPIRGAACGGTHRLGGLTLAYKTREARGEPVDGQYLKAKRFVTRYQQYAYRLQNRDGSFSTEWFRGAGNEDDVDRKLKTTGHILEWLLYAATEKELKHWKTTKAANYLANIMSRNRYRDWESGPLGHAIHALLVYDRLRFGPYDPPGQSTLAFKQPTSKRTQQRR